MDKIKRIFCENTDIDPSFINHFVQFEILIYLTMKLEKSYQVEDLYMLLGGRNIIIKDESYSNEDFMLFNAKLLLKSMNQLKVYRDTLKQYKDTQYDDIRLYKIAESTIEKVQPNIYQDREKDYERVLNTFIQDSIPTVRYPNNCKKYEYGFINKKNEFVYIDFPTDIEAVQIELGRNKKGGSLCVLLKELLEIADEIDDVTGDCFRRKLLLNNKIFGVREEEIIEVDKMVLENVQHIIGQVGAGKSTLMELIIILLARKGYRIAILESTVEDSILKAKLFESLGINVACIVGKNNKMHHIEGACEEKDFLDPYHSKIFTTGCILGALINKSDEGICYGDEPCYRIKRYKDDKVTNTNYVCPFYSKCPNTEIDRKVNQADVIITTLDGMCSSSILDRRELVFKYVLDRIDLVIIDEADSAICKLDQIFAPSLGINKYVQANAEIQNEYNKRNIDLKVNATEREFVESMNDLAKGLIQIWEEIKNVRTGFANYRLKKFTALQLLNLLNPNCPDLKTEEKLSLGEWQILYDLMKTNLSSKQSTLLSLAFNNDISWEYKFDLLGIDEIALSESTRRKLRFIIMLIAFDQIYRKVSNLVRSNNTLPIKAKQILNQAFTELQKYLPVAPIGNMLAFETKEDDLIITKQFATGRALALKFPWLKVNDHGEPLGPNVILLSGTSFSPESYMYHINTPVSYIIEAEQYKREYIAKTEFIPPLSNIRVSGSLEENKEKQIEKLLDESLEIVLEVLNGKKNILMIVNKYTQAEFAAKYLNKRLKKFGYEDNVLALKSDSDVTISEQTLKRSRIRSFNNRILIAPAVTIERGYNIVDEFGNSRFSTLMFLVRPMNDPTNYEQHVKKVNGAIMSKYSGTKQKACVATYNDIRKDAFSLYCKLTANKYSLSDLDKKLQNDITATLFVTICQIFGRLCRISSEEFMDDAPIKVYFMDAAFKSKNKKGYDFLNELVEYLDRVMEDQVTGNIAKTLYEPMYIALKKGSIYDDTEKRISLSYDNQDK